MSVKVIAQEEQKKPGFWRTAVSWLPRVLIGLALLAFVGYFIVYAIYAWQLFQFPFDYDQGEGFELMDTVLFSQGEWPYRDNDTYPFYSSNYPPLFHVITAPLVWLFGPQYWTGRLVSFLGTLITAAAIAYAVQRKGKRWWLSTLSGLAFLASNYVYHVGPLFRHTDGGEDELSHLPREPFVPMPCSSTPARQPPQAIARRMFRPLARTGRGPAATCNIFRGSITRPQHSLSTLRAALTDDDARLASV